METKQSIAAPRKPMRRYGEKNCGKVAHQCIRVGDLTFDSKAEHDRYLELLVMERSGLISQLCCQPRYEILPAQRIPGRPTLQSAHYTADFRYLDKDGVEHIEDVKSEYTRKDPAYNLRRKLMYLRHGIYVEEVVRG